MGRFFKPLTWGVLLAAGVVGAAVASDMAFQFVPNVLTPDPDIYDISIPSTNSYTDLVGIFADMDTSCPGGARQVTVFNPDQTTCTWNGPLSCNRAYVSGEGVRVSVGPPGCSTWLIVGSEEAGSSIVAGRTFPTPDPEVYFVSVPLNATAGTLAAVFSDLGPYAAGVTKFSPDQSTCTWNGPLSCNAGLAAGQAVRVSVSAPTVWIPSHY